MLQEEIIQPLVVGSAEGGALVERERDRGMVGPRYGKYVCGLHNTQSVVIFKEIIYARVSAVGAE